MADEPMVERLERLEREATPGPWRASPRHGPEGRQWVDNEQYDLLMTYSDAEGAGSNANFIVAMRNELPALLSQLREQKERADKAEVDAARWRRAEEQQVLDRTHRRRAHGQGTEGGAGTPDAGSH